MFEYQKTELNELNQTVGVLVEDTHMVQFEPIQLNGRWCKVIPLSVLKQEQELADIYKKIWRTVEREENARVWTYLSYSAFEDQAALEQAFEQNFHLNQAHHYVIQVGHLLWGWMGLININEQHRKAEIGNIYFSEPLRHTTAATEALYLLLNDCFERGFRKVEWRCDESNEASVNAAVRFGFLYEGTLRQDRIVKGRNRNTACFSILDEEWQKLKLAFEDWLKQDNFNLERQQKIRLEEFMQLYPITGRNEKNNV